jgi:hypothetical protein
VLVVVVVAVVAVAVAVAAVTQWEIAVRKEGGAAFSVHSFPYPILVP